MSFRYLGNKARIADWLGDTIQEYVPANATIADPMCGTATMSLAFAKRGYRVIAADELLFPVLHAKARLLWTDRQTFDPVAPTYEDALSILNGLAPLRGFFWREYSASGKPQNGCKPRMYFTGDNAAKIDAVRQRIKDWRRQGLSDQLSDLLLHDLILATNRVANIAGTYGYYRSKWNTASLKPLELKPTHPAQLGTHHEVWHGKVEDVACRITADAAYIDPPYTKRQYGGNYHILETLALEDEPTPAGEGGLRDWSPSASEFCYRRRAAGAFEKVLSSLQVPLVFISYSEDAHIPSDEMGTLLSAFGSVTRLKKDLERFRSNNRVSKLGDVEEHLYVLEMRLAATTRDQRNLGASAFPERPIQHRKVAA